MKACLNCKERYSGCHDECENKYKKEKNEQAKLEKMNIRKVEKARNLK